MINNACLIQHTYSNCNVFNPTFPDMQRLTYMRHSAYCMAHNIDFWSLQGGKYPKMTGESGAWAKVGLVREALQDYEYVFWIDVDAAIMDFAVDMRESVNGINIGGCVHDPAKAEWLGKVGIQRHINVGCLYFRNTDVTKTFVDKWFDAWPGPVRWADQGAFNALIAEMPDAVTEIDDKWNATVSVNMVENPVVLGWHGMPLTQRFLQMKNKLINDHLIYVV